MGRYGFVWRVLLIAAGTALLLVPVGWFLVYVSGQLWAVVSALATILGVVTVKALRDSYRIHERHKAGAAAMAADTAFLDQMERITAQVEVLAGKPNRTAAEEATLRELMEQAEKVTAGRARGRNETAR